MRALPALALLLALPAHATVGTPATATMLGYDPVDDKVFFEVTDGTEDTSDPNLKYFVVGSPPAGQRPDQPVVARSWQKPGYHERRARLVERLTALEPVPAEALTLTLEHGPLGPCGGQVGVDDAARARAVAQASGPGVVVLDGAEVSVCRQIAVEVSHGRSGVTTSVLTWGQVHLLGAWRVPGTERLVVAVRHTGVTYEGGYARDEVLLLN